MSAGSIIAVDVGNTVTRFGVARDGVLIAIWEIASSSTITPDEAYLTLRCFLSSIEEESHEAPYGEEGGSDAVPSAIKSAPHFTWPSDGIISSVVPSLTNMWKHAVCKTCGREPLVVGPGLKTGLKMICNDPGEVGSDRVADMVAAREIYGAPVLVIDLGTSTNFEILNERGEFAGGIIAPGLRLSAASLAHAAARLPDVEIAAPTYTIGKNTREAMQSGIVLGEVARIDGLVEMIWAELGYETKLVICGPDAETIGRLMQHEPIVDHALTLHGLHLIYQRNRNHRHGRA